MTPLLPTLCYICALRPHAGIHTKINGQITALSKRYTVELITLNYQPDRSIIHKLFSYLRFELCAALAMITNKKVYVRFCHKSLFTLFISGILSWFKDVYWEHNGDIYQDLKIEGRNIEAFLIRFLFPLVGLTAVRHICMTEEIKDRIQTFFNVHRTPIVIQNGYLLPTVSASDIDQSVVSQVNTFKSSVKQIGIFVGKSYAWQGIDVIIDLFKPYPDIGIIIIGCKRFEESHPNILWFEEQSQATLFELFKLSDFGIGPMNRQLITLNQACPLKVREYLCHGLPILVNYEDSAWDFKDLRPIFFECIALTMPCLICLMRQFHPQHLNKPLNLYYLGINCCQTFKGISDQMAYFLLLFDSY